MPMSLGQSLWMWYRFSRYLSFYSTPPTFWCWIYNSNYCAHMEVYFSLSRFLYDCLSHTNHKYIKKTGRELTKILRIIYWVVEYGNFYFYVFLSFRKLYNKHKSIYYQKILLKWYISNIYISIYININIYKILQSINLSIELHILYMQNNYINVFKYILVSVTQGLDWEKKFYFKGQVF